MRRGVLCAIMTDGPARNPWMILAQAGEAVRFGCPAERVLRMITINAATILGCEDRIGSLEVGKDADLVLFDQKSGRFHRGESAADDGGFGEVVYRR